MKKLRKNKKGFTLIELIVVIAILGILVLLAAPRFLGYTKDAQKVTMQADAKVLSNAALVYNIENEGKWPVLPAAENEEQNTVTFKDFDDEDVTVKVRALDKTEFKNHVQTLKNDIDNYKMVDEKKTIKVAEDKDENDETVEVFVELQKGDIIYVGNDGAGVKDRAGNTHYGVQLKIEKPAAETETETEADGE